MDVGCEHAWPDREIGAIVVRQGTMIGHAQLRGLGVPPRSIGHALRRGRLYPVHVGVYSLVPERARPAYAAEHAALLACGEDAVLSHRPAALLHGLRLDGAPRTRDLDVTVPPHGRGRTRPGIIAHRTSDLPRSETARVHGLRVTSIARTVLDLSPSLRPRGLAEVVDQALRKTSRSKLLDVVEHHPRRPGAPALREVLSPTRPSAEVWSRTERRLRAMFRRAGLPEPESNVPIGRLIPDFLWREQRVIGEYDSEGFHFGPAGRRGTWERHNHFQALGFTVVHVTWEDLRDHPDQVLVRIAAALVRAGWAPA